MSKKMNHRFEPELRFPEFKGTPQWEKLPIGKKVELLSGYPFKSQDMTDDPDGTPLLRGINITEGHIRHSKDIDRYIAGDVSAFKKYLLKKDDLVIGMDGSKVGKNSALVSTDDAGSLLIQRVARLRSGCNSTIQFIYQHVHSSIFHSFVDRVNTSGGIPHISAKQINDFEICFPEDTREQQKIADCLSSLDELIAAHTQKHQELQSYKKGLLQNLFPAEGKTVPALRFPEFENTGDWEVNTLEDVSTFRRGSFPQPYGLPEWYDDENGQPFVQVVDVGDDMRLKPTTKRKISEAACEQSVYIEKGTVIITIQGSIGRVAVTHYDAYIDRTLLLFQSFLKPIDKYFFAYILQILFFIEEQKAPGGIIKTITKETLRSFIVKLPRLEEQQKIANCLSSVDDLIMAQSHKIEELKAHKKGLMAKLFPAVGEVL